MYTLNLTGEQVKLIYEALLELPAKQSMDTLATIRTQVDAHNKAQATAAAEPQPSEVGTAQG